MSLSTNTTYRVYVEKIGDQNPATFVGDEGEVFYDPSSPTLKLSDGSTPGGVTIAGGGGGGGESYWVSTAAGIHTLSNVGVGTTNPTTKLQVGGVLGFGAGNNVRIGDNTTGASLTSGFNNVLIGPGAGNSNVSGAYNIFFGSYSGYSAVSTFKNTFIGEKTGRFATSGNNTFLGSHAGYFTTTGTSCNFLGFYAGYYNSTGIYNNFIGFGAGFYNTVGVRNNFLGGYAGNYNTIGNDNLYVGNFTGFSTSTSRKIIIGSGYERSFSGMFDAPDTTKDTQFAVGVKTDANPANYWLVGNENFNIGIGTTNPTTKLQVGGVIGFNIDQYGRTNIRIGDNTTGANLTSGSNNMFMGIGAGRSTTEGYDNNFLGENAGIFNTTGYSNQFIGRRAGYNNIFGYYNCFFGTGSGDSNVTGYYNSFFGTYSGTSNISGNYNVSIGHHTGISTSASYRVVLGFGNYNSNFDAPDTTKDTQFAVGVRTDANPSKYWIVGNENFNVGVGTTNPQTKLEIGGVLGFGAGNNVRIGDNTTGASLTSGIDNIFMGVGAGSSTIGGTNNNFFGRYAGRFNTNGTYNNFIGENAGYYNTNGSNNTFIGKSAGYYNLSGAYNNFFGFAGGYKNTTGSNNNFIGNGAGFYNTTGNSNSFFGQYSGNFNTIGEYNLFLGSFTGISTSASNKVILGRGYNFSNTFDAPDTTKDTQFAVGIRTDANPANYWLVGNENFNVGIGTTNPTTKLTVGGDIRAGFTTSHGVVLTSPNGTQYRLIVDNSGVLSTVAV